MESLLPDTGLSLFRFQERQTAVKPKLGADTSSERGQLIRTEVLQASERSRIDSWNSVNLKASQPTFLEQQSSFNLTDIR